jgi:hypothetical protein
VLWIRTHWIWIRIQHFNWIRIRIQGFDDQKLKEKNTAEKLFIFFWSKITIYLSLGLHKGRLSDKRSLKSSKKMKFINFSFFVGHFCTSGSGLRIWIQIRIQGPHWIRIQSGSGSTTLLAGSGTLPIVGWAFYRTIAALFWNMVGL